MHLPFGELLGEASGFGFPGSSPGSERLNPQGLKPQCSAAVNSGSHRGVWRQGFVFVGSYRDLCTRWGGGGGVLTPTAINRDGPTISAFYTRRIHIEESWFKLKF